MAVGEVINWSTETRGNPSPVPFGPDGSSRRRVGLSMQEIMSSIARYRDTLSGTTGTLLLSADDPWLALNEEDALSDNRYWDIHPINEQLRFRALNDAGSVAADWMTVDRTGTTIDAVAINATQFSAGTYLFNIDQTVGATEDGYTLTYDDGTGQISLSPAAGGGMITGKYRFDTSTATGPSSGRVRFDTGAYGTVTELFISDTTDEGGDATNFLGALSTGDQIYFQETNDAATFSVWEVSGAVTDEGSWFRVPVTEIANGVFPGNNDKSTMALSYTSGVGGGGGGDVTKVGTPVNNELGVWTGDGTLEGEANLTYNAGTLTVGVGATGYIKGGASQALIIGGADNATQVALRGPTTPSAAAGPLQLQGGYSSLNAGGEISISGGGTGASSTLDAGNIRITPGFNQGSGAEGRIILSAIGVGGRKAPILEFSDDYGGTSYTTGLRAGTNVPTQNTIWTLPNQGHLSVGGKWMTVDNSGVWSFVDIEQLESSGNVFLDWNEGVGQLTINTGTGAKSEAMHLDASRNAYMKGHFIISPAKRFYLDDGVNTYIAETSADNVEIVTGGTAAVTFGVGQNATFSSKILSAASTAGRTGFNMAEGVAPSSPDDGDHWLTAAGEYFVRLNGVSVDLSAGGGGGDVTKVGTPVNGELGVWTGDGTLEGADDLTWSSTRLTLGLTSGNAAALRINGPATGQPEIRFQQASVDKAKISFVDSDETLYFHSPGWMEFATAATQEIFMRFDETAGSFEVKTGVGTKTTALTIDSAQLATFNGNVEINSATSTPALQINYTNTGFFDHAIDIAVTGGSGAITIHDSDNGQGAKLIEVSSNNAGRLSEMVKIHQDNSASSGTGVNIIQDGDGYALTTEANRVDAIAARFYSNTASRTEALVEIVNDNATGSGVALEIQSDQGLAVSVTAGQVTLAASIAAHASLNIPEGVAPTSPVDGDTWVTSAGAFMARLNGASVNLAAGAAGGDAWSDPVDAIITPDGDSTRDLGLTGTRFDVGYFNALDLHQVGATDAFVIDSDGTGRAIDINHAGTDRAVFITNAGSSSALKIQSNSDGSGIYVDDLGSTTAAGDLLNLSSNISGRTGQLAYIWQNHASSLATSLFVRQDADVTGLEIDMNHAGLTGYALVIDTQAAGGINIDTNTTVATGINMASSGAFRTSNLVTLTQSSTSPSLDILGIVQSGLGSAIDIADSSTGFSHAVISVAITGSKPGILVKDTSSSFGQALLNLNSDNASRITEVGIITQDNASSTANLLELKQDGTGKGLYLQHLGSNGIGVDIIGNHNSRTDDLVYINQNGASSSSDALHVRQGGTGDSITVYHAGTNGYALNITADNASRTNDVAQIYQTSGSVDADVLALYQSGTGNALYAVGNNAAGTAIRAYSSIASRTQPLVEFVNDSSTGSGVVLYLQQDQSGHAFHSQVTNAGARAGYFYSNIATRTVPVVEIINDHATGSGVALQVRGDQGLAIHVTNGDVHFEGYFRPNLATDTELNAIANAINTNAGKIQGAMVYNITQDTPVWAVGSADGDLWVDGAGATINTPV